MRLGGEGGPIQGGGGGVGELTPKQCGSEGPKLVVSDVVDDAGHATVEEIRADGGEAAFVHADVSNASDAEAMVRFAVDTFGGLHIMMNNAGIFHPQDDSVTNNPDDVW